MESNVLTGVAAAAVLQRPVERRDGEAVLLPPKARRALPRHGLRVLMVGGTPADRMLQGFLLGDLPEVSRLESAAEPFLALRAISAQPRRYDLLLLDRALDAFDSFDFVATLRRCAGGDMARLPLVVLLADRFGPADRVRSDFAGAFAARLLKPLSVEHCRELIGRLFHG